ncbi:MAG: glycosyltransferase [Flavobacteriaceae bacterium]|jgi:glycosyltransferase involved in cell wall biosynthesis|nr:glycosyltransferase [Flavobacteriaceae bacterium]
MKQKIKILHIQETIGSGGVERRRLSLAKHLDKNLFDQKFICTQAIGNIPDEIRAEGFEVIPIGKLKSPFDWKQHRKVQKMIEDYQPDIIHGAVFEGVTMATINGWLKKVPVVIIEETSDPQNRSWKGNMLMKVFSRLADKVIGVSEGVTKEYLIGKLGISDKKAIAINNGVALPRKVSILELEKVKKEFGISENDFVIGSVGRMLQDSHKRFSDLIKAFAEFSKEKENVKLLLVGDGSEKEGYQKLAKDLEVSDKVVFAGYQSDVSLLYQMMDVFALVSAREAFGLVLAEAMLNKLPVIATRVGGMKYIVEDQETGFLVEPLQVQEIKEKIEILYLDAELRKTLGNNGFEKAMREYTEESYVKSIQDLYQSLVNKP